MAERLTDAEIRAAEQSASTVKPLRPRQESDPS
jgi:hypothetical protein